MKMITENNTEILTKTITEFFNVQQYKDILSFALQDVDLSDDVSAEKSKVDLQNYPYLVQPLQNCAIEKGIRKEICVAMPEQMGKTMLQLITLLFNTVYNNLQAIICYPSVQLAVETSTVKFIPLFKKIPQFAEEINKPFAIRSDRLKLSNAIIYWQGAGAKVVSRSSKLVLGDQCAIWETPHNVNNLNELKKRTRSYNECLQLFVSTPHYSTDHFWRQWLNGSRAFYHLYCCGCGQQTMRSADIHNLQFETVYNEELKQYIAVRGSERLICPKCGYQHVEAEKETMIKKGGYIHTFPQKAKEYPTFQCGVLASLLNVHSWGNIADLQLSSGKGATLEDHISMDNSIRGLPYQQREYNKQDETALSKHYYKVDQLIAQDIEAVVVSADTQDTFSVYVVTALTKQNNYYVLQMGRCRYLWLQEQQRKIINEENKRNKKQPEKTLLDVLEKEYFGIKPLCLLVDMRGHRAEEIKNFSKMRHNILMWGGTNLKYDKWKISENNPKLFLCDAKKFQAQLLFMLYGNQNKGSNFLYLPHDIDQKDVEEIISFQPDAEKRNGNIFENWTPKDKVHDMFDTLKMSLACIQIASKIYRKRFRLGEAKILQNTVKKTKKTVKTAVKKPLFRRY